MGMKKRNILHIIIFILFIIFSVVPNNLKADTFTKKIDLEGNKGVDVKTLQKYLNTHGYNVAFIGPGSLNNETEYFGPLTHAAVIRFQYFNNLVIDGIVGPLTLEKMK